MMRCSNNYIENENRRQTKLAPTWGKLNKYMDKIVLINAEQLS